MSLNAREQKALDSIKDGLGGSDPEMAALLSAFTWLASGQGMPDREKTRAASRRAFRQLRRARWRSSLRRMCQPTGIRQAALLLLLLTSAALIAVAVALNAGGDHATCVASAATVCTNPASGHSTGPASDGTATGQAPQQPAAVIGQAGP